MIFLTGCKKMDRIYIYTPDKKQCITVFNSNEIRYIVDGEHANIPDTNYLKLDVRQIDPLGDGIWICLLQLIDSYLKFFQLIFIR